MKKLLLLLPILFLVGCANNVSPTTPSGTPPEEGEPTDPGEVDPGEGGEVDPETDPREEETSVTGIKLNFTEYVFDTNDLNKKKNIFYIDYLPNNDVSNDEKEVVWTSTDTSVFEIRSDTGGITPKGYGSAYAVATTVLGGYSARCFISVVEDKTNVQYEYQLVEDISSIKDKDTIVFAAPNAGMTASNNSQGSYLHGVSSTFSSDKKKITSLGEDSAEFYVGEEENGFTLENQNGKYFAGFNLTRVGFVSNKGNIEWRFTIDEGELYIETYNDVRGWLMFNEDTNGFTLYESTPTFDLYMPSIYRLTLVK